MKRLTILTTHPLLGPLDYLSSQDLPFGKIVTVPLGQKEYTGTVWPSGDGRSVAAEKLRPIVNVLDVPPLTPDFIDLIDWCAGYYCVSLGGVLKMALPRLAKLPTRRPTKRQLLPEALSVTDRQPITLNTEQVAVKKAIADHLGPSLLHGVTGAGKTEVALELIAEDLERDSKAQILILIPEIALVSVWEDRLIKRFGFAPAIWHSSQSPARRRDAWYAIVRGEKRIILGARSALFLPIPRLARIVVDEEQDVSYKQSDHIPYHARDVAVMRSRLAQCPVLLASATPSLESWINCEVGRYQHFRLAGRYGGASLPKITPVNLCQERLERNCWLTPQMISGLEQVIARGEQGLLFLNRRGYAPLSLCRACGVKLICPNCSAYLVEHRQSSCHPGSPGLPRLPRLLCHHCSYERSVPDTCPSCSEPGTIIACGPGVERIEQELRDLLPQARSIILTSDTLATPVDLQSALEAIHERKIDVIIGSQVITKGHHFPHLTFVGVIDADSCLNPDDFRAPERLWQQMIQVSGRAGRGDSLGQALLQCWAPQDPLIQALINGEEEKFYTMQARARRARHHPPFTRLVAVIVSGKKSEEVERQAKNLARTVPQDAGVECLGPISAPLNKIRGLYRMRLLLKIPRRLDHTRLIDDWKKACAPSKSVQHRFDVDPYNFL